VIRVDGQGKVEIDDSERLDDRIITFANPEDAAE
jgi:hypothetical protein